MITTSAKGPGSKASMAMMRYADGDTRAFVEVYDELSPSLFHYLQKLTRNDAAAEDLLQQTFLRMHDARGRFEPGAAVEPWAFSIARRLFIDWYRHGRAFVASGLLDDDTLPTNEPDAEAIVHGYQLAERLERMLNALPAQHREVFLLVREHGLSLAQAAEALGITQIAVKMRAHRAYEGLRVVFEENLGERRET
ncbi:MAG TPA: RNA polymerase sigma factor [Polyangium sp.]|nr:RNA polymerase sigma factor [Polyangium sp.]